MKTVMEQFINPNADYRGKPFWSWNGKLDKQELIRQIDIFKDMGFGGFFMHSRTGLQTEYLGDEWFELINACADRAEELGLEAWLYDEDRWPSGTAGGEVTKNVDYRLKFIRLQMIPAEQFTWNDNIIAAFSCVLVDEINYYNCRKVERDEKVNGSAGYTVLCFSIEEMEKSTFYNGYTYVDTMNRQATDYYLKITHDRYKEMCGDRLGKSIKGIFTDEPHRGALMDGFGIENKDSSYLAPWTPKLFAAFEEKFGFDLIPHLPELFLRKDGEPVSHVKWCYVELLQDLFIENFAKPSLEWCRENNIQLTGHILHEDSLTAQVAMSGSVMRYYEYMDIPGIDILTENNKSFWVAKQLSSVARQLGQPWMLSELYGCTGWQMGFQGHKEVGDWQALFGVNLRCHHLSWYTMEGEAKRDYPASINFQSGWWKEYKTVEDYFSRLGVVLQQGKSKCDVLVIHPVESVWCQVYPGWSTNLGPQSDGVKDLEKDFIKLFYGLSGNQIDFDYGDEEMMSRLYKVIKGEGKPKLVIGKAEYEVVIVPNMVTIRKTTLNILEEFISAGGHVIFAGEIPGYVDAIQTDSVKPIANQAFHVPFDVNEIANLCRTVSPSKMEIIDTTTNKTIPDLFCQIRQSADQTIYVVLNINREKEYKNVRFRFYDQGSLEEWDCLTGKRWKLQVVKSEEFVEVDMDVCPSDLHVFVLQHENKSQNIELKPRLEIEQSESLEGPFSYELNEPNVCVLDMARFHFDTIDEQKTEMDVLKIDQVVRRHTGLNLRSGEMIQPWYMDKYYSHKDKQYGEIILWHDFYMENVLEKPIELVLEQPDQYVININGNELSYGDVGDWWIDPCFKKIVIPNEYLNEGKNTIKLRAQFHQRLNLEAIYLIGDFGVKLDGIKKVITTLPNRLYVGNVVEQGLPFYSGTISYHLNIGNSHQSNRLVLSVDEFEAACIKVRNHTQEKILPWKPYEIDITDIIERGSELKLDLILTRRNTFGPLHQIPLYAPAYGPNNFITEGESYSKDYNLVPSGLTNAPKIKLANIKNEEQVAFIKRGEVHNNLNT